VNLDQDRALLRAFDNPLEISCEGCKPSSKLKQIQLRLNGEPQSKEDICRSSVLLLDGWQKEAIYGSLFGSPFAY
jgi:hypothetical protein